VRRTYRLLRSACWPSVAPAATLRLCVCAHACVCMRVWDCASLRPWGCTNTARWRCISCRQVRGAKRVVGVLGRGHLRGVTHALLRDKGGAGLRFTDLVDGRNSRRKRAREAASGLARFALELGLGFAAYAAWLEYAAEM
jgi:hypothetical protein